MPLDYSKWDNIDCSSDEEEESVAGAGALEVPKRQELKKPKRKKSLKIKSLKEVNLSLIPRKYRPLARALPRFLYETDGGAYSVGKCAYLHDLKVGLQQIGESGNINAIRVFRELGATHMALRVLLAGHRCFRTRQLAFEILWFASWHGCIATRMKKACPPYKSFEDFGLWRMSGTPAMFEALKEIGVECSLRSIPRTAELNKAFSRGWLGMHEQEGWMIMNAKDHFKALDIIHHTVSTSRCVVDFPAGLQVGNKRYRCPEFILEQVVHPCLKLQPYNLKALSVKLLCIGLNENNGENYDKRTVDKTWPKTIAYFEELLRMEKEGLVTLSDPLIWFNAGRYKLKSLRESFMTDDVFKLYLKAEKLWRKSGRAPITEWYNDFVNHLIGGRQWLWGDRLCDEFIQNYPRDEPYYYVFMIAKVLGQIMAFQSKNSVITSTTPDMTELRKSLDIYEKTKRFHDNMYRIESTIWARYFDIMDHIELSVRNWNDFEFIHDYPISTIRFSKALGSDVVLSCSFCGFLEPSCEHCGCCIKRLKMCPCKAKRYCSTICQKMDWGAHKKQHKKLLKKKKRPENAV